MIIWTLLSLLTVCVLEESTKRYMSETTVTKLSKALHEHVILPFKSYQGKSTFYEYTVQEVFNHDTGEGIIRYLSHLTSDPTYLAYCFIYCNGEK